MITENLLNNLCFQNKRYLNIPYILSFHKRMLKEKGLNFIPEQRHSHYQKQQLAVTKYHKSTSNSYSILQ